MARTRNDSTQDIPDEGGPGAAATLAGEPGAVLVFDGTEPACTPIPLGETALELGRGSAALGPREDAAMSRQHARLAYRDGGFRITDLGSRNGSALDGRPLRGEVASQAARVLRLGHSLLLLCHDIRPYRKLGVRVAGPRIEGPALQQVMQQVAGLAMLGRTLLILGNSGTGKESIARAFHSHGPSPDGAFIAVNCATIPEGLAERLLFGAQKGAYSGAVADSQGYLTAAAGGTLFLDEVAELDAAVQAKLLRVLESGEVAPLGATRARKVELRVCCATHKPLRELVAQGKFRADLYFRLWTPHVELPPLLRRPEEIPWHLSGAVRETAPELRVQSALIEACLLRPWPGNVRELILAARAAAFAAHLAGSSSVGLQHLDRQAGMALGGAGPPAPPPPTQEAAPLELPQPAPAPVPADENALPSLSRAEVVAAIVAADGNISAAARALGVHRTQLRRLLARHQINIQKLRDLS